MNNIFLSIIFLLIFHIGMFIRLRLITNNKLVIVIILVLTDLFFLVILSYEKF